MQKIAIIGGSIAGNAMALALSRLGFDVNLYERSHSALSDRGVGICIPKELRHALVKEKFFNHDAKYLEIDDRQFVVNDHNHARIIWKQPVNIMAHNWSEIYSQLHQKLPQNIYHKGVSVDNISQADNKVTLLLSNGESTTVDWLFCCDGVNSICRQSLFPDAQLEAAPYIAWRGVIAKDKLNEAQFFERLNYFCYDHGHVVTYYIPSISGGIELNWVAYQKLDNSLKQKLLTDKNNQYCLTGIPTNRLTKWHYTMLDALADDMPNIFAQAMRSTPSPFIQNIFDVKVPALKKGRICLSGDAAFISRPHTASGATKALQSALILSQQLINHNNDLEKATDEPIHLT
uniref:FAD binding domain-containing protein n=2 Tax=Facilibium subflavum TaxID=2219058 RepID=UPI000E648CE4